MAGGEGIGIPWCPHTGGWTAAPADGGTLGSWEAGQPDSPPDGSRIPRSRPCPLGPDREVWNFLAWVVAVLSFGSFRWIFSVRILLVEDDKDLGEAIVKRLRRDGHGIDWQNTGEGADGVLRYQEYDVIVLDIGLPKMDGFAVLQGMRRRGCKTPVLMLTARSNIQDRVGALDLGADDYLPKPFDFREFDARCRALLRRSQGIASNFIHAGSLKVDQAAKLVWVDDTPVELPNREFRLLEIFVTNLGRIFSKDGLSSHLSDFDEDLSSNAIELYVGRLRKRLGQALVIRTIRGQGYRAEPPDDGSG